MSKKYKNKHLPGNATFVAGGDHSAEYGIIKSDLVKVAVVNVIFLAAVLAVYYTNLHSNYLEKFASQYLKF